MVSFSFSFLPTAFFSLVSGYVIDRVTLSRESFLVFFGLPRDVWVVFHNSLPPRAVENSALRPPIDGRDFRPSPPILFPFAFCNPEPPPPPPPPSLDVPRQLEGSYAFFGFRGSRFRVCYARDPFGSTPWCTCDFFFRKFLLVCGDPDLSDKNVLFWSQLPKM